MKKKGFTLIEVVIAMFISTLVIFGVITAYLNGVTLMSQNGKQLRAQQEGILTMNQICDSVRESIGLDVLEFSPPLLWSNTEQGNFLVTYSPVGGTTAYYYVGNNMYCVPGFTAANFSTANKYLLAKNIKADTYFLEESGKIYLNFEITDSDDTNLVLFSSGARFTPRN